jgi:pyruvate carboxylase
MKEFRDELGEKLTDLDFISYKLYPKVFKDYLEHRNTYGTVYRIPTLAFLYGLKPGEDIQIPLAIGKTLSIKYLYRTDPDEKGYRRVSFELNGQSRIVKVKDESLEVEIISNRKAKEPNEIGAPLQGRLAKILVKAGDKVKTNDVLFVLEAMKMESSVVAIKPGTVKAILLAEGALVEQDDLVVEMED